MGTARPLVKTTTTATTTTQATPRPPTQRKELMEASASSSSRRMDLGMSDVERIKRMLGKESDEILATQVKYIIVCNSGNFLFIFWCFESWKLRHGEIFSKLKLCRFRGGGINMRMCSSSTSNFTKEMQKNLILTRTEANQTSSADHLNSSLFSAIDSDRIIFLPLVWQQPWISFLKEVRENEVILFNNYSRQKRYFIAAAAAAAAAAEGPCIRDGRRKKIIEKKGQIEWEREMRRDNYSEEMKNKSGTLFPTKSRKSKKIL